MKFVFDNNLPIYIQLVEQLKKQIISGTIPPGSRLPSVRELASITKVNPNTMQKALASLEELKLIYTERTNGKFVTDDKNLLNKFKEKFAHELLKEYFENMQSIGFTKEDTIKYINNMEEKK